MDAGGCKLRIFSSREIKFRVHSHHPPLNLLNIESNVRRFIATTCYGVMHVAISYALNLFYQNPSTYAWRISCAMKTSLPLQQSSGRALANVPSPFWGSYMIAVEASESYNPLSTFSALGQLLTTLELVILPICVLRPIVPINKNWYQFKPPAAQTFRTQLLFSCQL